MDDFEDLIDQETSRYNSIEYSSPGIQIDIKQILIKMSNNF